MIFYLILQSNFCLALYSFSAEIKVKNYILCRNWSWSQRAATVWAKRRGRRYKWNQAMKSYIVRECYVMTVVLIMWQPLHQICTEHWTTVIYTISRDNNLVSNYIIGNYYIFLKKTSWQKDSLLHNNIFWHQFI